MKITKLILSLVSLASLDLVGCTKASSSENTCAVTYNYNYENAPAPKVMKYAKGAAFLAPEDPLRDGFSFTGWFTEATIENAYDFATILSTDLTLYAGWLDNSATSFTVTFDENYEGAPTAKTVKVQEGSPVAKPVNPTREGYEFKNWFSDKNLTTVYAFTSPVTKNITLYGGWDTQFVFEAEYISGIEDLVGAGYSGTATGTDMIVEDTKNAGASNHYYVTYLYVNQMTLNYVIQSDSDVTDAKMVLRLSAEVMDITISPSNYFISVNEKGIGYSAISFTNVPKQGTGEVKPFADYVITKKLSLKKGSNTISLITANQDKMFGTMEATAPMVDCMKITTSAALTWEPCLSNLSGI
jgi:uncharacterized repeat protein (TIGR02543 family)